MRFPCTAILIPVLTSFTSVIRRRSTVRILLECLEDCPPRTPCTFLHGGPKYICPSHSYLTVSTRGGGSHLHARFRNRNRSLERVPTARSQNQSMLWINYDFMKFTKRSKRRKSYKLFYFYFFLDISESSTSKYCEGKI